LAERNHLQLQQQQQQQQQHCYRKYFLSHMQIQYITYSVFFLGMLELLRCCCMYECASPVLLWQAGVSFALRSTHVYCTV
jgi:hypothetical protein